MMRKLWSKLVGGGLPDGLLGFKMSLSVRVIRAGGRVEDLGVICRRLVTTAFVVFLVDALQALADITTFKYHDAGIGTGAEAVGNTGMGSAWGGARAVGTQAEGATANIYRSVGVITFNNTFAITEHGLFSASTTGTLMDRSLFAAINVVNGDSIEFTYELTATAGG